MKRFWLPVAVGVLSAAGCASDAPSTPTPPDDGEAQLSPAVIAQMESLIAEKAARTPAQRKISSALLYAKDGKFAAALESKDPSKQITSLNQTDDKGRVLVDLKGNMAALGGKIESLGGSVVNLRQDGARAWVALDQLETLAAEGAVRSIRAAHQAQTRRIDKPGVEPKFQTGTRADRIAAVQRAKEALSVSPIVPSTTGGAVANVGAAQSQGDRAHGADRARRFFGADGTGVKIGVISDSDDFKEQSIASGDLPPDTVTVPGQDGRPGSGEGTAMMEIVHDVVPGAKLFFATAFLSPESFADNIRRLRFEFGCDVIIDDIIYFFESPFTDDIIAAAVDDVTADGALFFSSAGNEGNADDGFSGTWEGDFRASGTLATLPSGYTVHSFGNGVISNRIEVGGGPLILHWSDPASLERPQSSNDYDLFVLDSNLRSIAVAATDIQDGDDLAFEFLGFNIPPGFQVVIAAAPGAETRAVRTVLFGGEFALSTGGATYGHATANDAFGVAAVDAAEAINGVFQPGQITPVELFSADGPRRIFFDRFNSPTNPANPGQTFASRGGVSRAKPDIAAADGVSTTLPPGSGLNPFFGTSAAAPHAGAIAALVKSAVPGITPARVRTALLASAIDIEAAGADRNSGRGVVSAFNALLRAGARAAVNLAAGEITVTPLGSDAVVPGTAALVNVQLTNSGGAAAQGVTATLSSTSADVLILQGASAYPVIAPESSATNVTPFAFFVNPGAVCGALLPFRLTVNFTGAPAPVIVNFSVQTGRAGGAGTTISYAGPVVAIPDANPAGVNVTLPVSGIAAGIAKAVFSIDGATCNANIGSTTVGLDHTWVGDLALRLRSPAGTVVTLMSAPGGAGNSGNNFCQTVLDDGAAASIQNVAIAQAPFTGSFRPAQALSAFNGQSANGDWVLNVSDNAAVDTGSVRAFSLNVSGFSCAR